jgi:(p)ppGpp synthase/HD superfamily hydrolase
MLAQIYASAAHAAIGQKRKFSGEAYINHPERVVNILTRYQYFDINMLSAAWLHDVVEDTSVTLGDISMFFNEEITTLVSELTNTSKLSEGNRAKRKELDKQRISSCSYVAKTIKLADIYDNCLSFINDSKIHPEAKKFGEIWVKEKKDLMSVLTDSDQKLYNDTMSLLTNNGTFF